MKNAYTIFGPDLAGHWGKTVRKSPSNIEPEYFSILQEIIEKNKLVTLSVDIMFLNQLPFVIMYGRGIGLTTVEWIPNNWRSN